MQINVAPKINAVSEPIKVADYISVIISRQNADSLSAVWLSYDYFTGNKLTQNMDATNIMQFVTNNSS